MRGACLINLLHSKANSAPSTKRDEEFIQVFAICSSLYPALWLEFLRLWEDARVHVYKVGGHADGGLGTGVIKLNQKTS